MLLEDGKGRGFKQEVNKENQAVVSAITTSELEHESEENSEAYNWHSLKVDIDAADTVLLLKNDSDTPLHIEEIFIANGDGTAEYQIHLPTTEVTLAGGTVVTGTNLNTGGVSNVAEASARSDETNNVQGNILYTVHLFTETNMGILTPGLILGKNKSLGIDVVDNSRESAATIIGHYSD